MFNKRIAVFVVALVATAACKPRDFNSTEGDTASALTPEGLGVLRLRSTENVFTRDKAEETAYWWNLYRQNKDNFSSLDKLPGKATIVRCDGAYLVLVSEPTHADANKTQQALFRARHGGGNATKDFRDFAYTLRGSYTFGGRLSEYPCNNREYIIPTWDPLKK